MNPNLKRKLQLIAGFGVFIIAVAISYFSVVEVESQEEFVKQDIFLVFDVSPSMGVESKFESAKAAALEFTNALNLNHTSGYQIGLISFSRDANLIVDLSTDRDDLSQGINRLYLSDSTNVGAGILLATENLSDTRSNAEKTIILLSDGASNVGPDPLQAALTAKTKDVTILAIGYGYDADVWTLQSIADTTNGKYFNAATGNDLIDTFNDIEEFLISPTSHYSSRIMVLIAIPILLFIPAIEVGFATIMGRLDDKPIQRNIKKQPCPHCEHLNRSEAKFCLKCGKSIQGEENDEPIQRNIKKQPCPHCEHLNRSEAKFCLKCGKSIQEGINDE